MRSRLLIVTAFLVFASLACAPASAGPTPTLFEFPTVTPSLPTPTPPTITVPPLETLNPGVPTPTAMGGEGNSGGEATAPPDAEYATVNLVIDGDTIGVSLRGEDYRVRYIGMNTPERDEPCYQDATDRNRELVEDQIVMLVKDVSETVPNGRLLRYVYVGETLINAVLVAEGWAEARRYEPDTAQYDYFDSLEAAAANQGLGCWPTGVFER